MVGQPSLRTGEVKLNIFRNGDGNGWNERRNNC